MEYLPTWRNFLFIFGVVLGELILAQSDNLSKSLHVKVLTPLEGQKQAEFTLKTLESLKLKRCLDSFRWGLGNFEVD